MHGFLSRSLLFAFLLSGSFVATPATALVEYVIVTTDELAPEFQRLADARALEGFTSEVRTLSWIDANYPQGVDAAERVRLHLIDAFANDGTLWVLLGGDAGVLPVRYARTTLQGGTDLLSDAYFMCLDGTWDANGNGIYGEVEDAVDLRAELFLGRAPVSTLADAAAFVDKTIAQSGAGATSYPRSIVAMAERLFPSLHGADIAELHLNQLPPDFEILRLYEESASYPGSFELSRAAALDALNDGYGIVLHVANQIDDGEWSVGSETVTNADIAALTNAGRPSIVYGYDGDSARFDLAGDSIGETFVRHPDGGAIAYVSATETAWVNAQQVFSLEWLRLFGDVQHVGEATALARLPLIPGSELDSSARWTLMTMVLLGDPLVRVPGAGTTGIGELAVPAAGFGLEVSPNPFNPSTTLRFDVPEGAGVVTVAIHDALGRHVRTLLSQPMESGSHSVRWDGRSESGVARSGVYWATMRAGDRVASTKVTLVK